MTASPSNSKFTLGLSAGLLGRWTRLILGGFMLVYVIFLLITNQPSLGFYGEAALYFVGVFGAYLVAHYYLGERFFARVNPWITTLILVGPPVVMMVFQLGPVTYQLAFSLYASISLIFNFFMSYGGCEVVAIPSLIFRRRYVVYCPWNVVDVVDKVIVERRAIPVEG